MLPEDSNSMIPFGQPHDRRVGGYAIELLFYVFQH